jgi:hypothetical protein
MCLPSPSLWFSSTVLPALPLLQPTQHSFLRYIAPSVSVASRFQQSSEFFTEVPGNFQASRCMTSCQYLTSLPQHRHEPPTCHIWDDQHRLRTTVSQFTSDHLSMHRHTHKQRYQLSQPWASSAKAQCLALLPLALYHDILTSTDSY